MATDMCSLIGNVRGFIYGVIQRLLFWVPPRKQAAAPEVHVIYKPDAIGDLVLASGAVRTLISTIPGRWVLITSPQAAPLAEEYFPDLELKILQGSNRHAGLGDFWAKVKSIRSYCKQVRVSTLVCLKHASTGMDHVIMRWCAPMRSVGISASPIPNETPSGFRKLSFTSELTYPRERTHWPLEMEAHRRVVSETLHREVSDQELQPVSPHDLSSSPDEAPVLLVFPATRSPLRNVPPEVLGEAICKWIADVPNARIWICGQHQEAALMESLQGTLPAEVSSELLFPGSILDVVKRIQESDLLLAMESAPAHLAISMDKPGVFLLGGGHFEHFAPWQLSEAQEWLWEPMECFGCNWSCLFPEAYCTTRIASDRIMAALRRVYEVRPPATGTS